MVDPFNMHLKLFIEENTSLSPYRNICYIVDICFFEVNTKYISSSELKTSEFSRVRSTSENYYVSNSRDEIYLVFTGKKHNFSFYFIQYTGIFQFTKQAVKMQKPKNFENTNNFGTTLFLTF